MPSSTERCRRWRELNPVSEERRLQHREAQQRRREKLMARGLCHCGKERADKAFLCCEKCRAAAARRMGRKPAKPREQRHHGESPKWAALDALMANPCDRCGLRGDHDCLPLHPDGSARRGPGRTYPDIG